MIGYPDPLVPTNGRARVIALAPSDHGAVGVPGVGRRRWVEADRNVTFWREHERGGHFAAMERPDDLVADIREFFRDLR